MICGIYSIRFKGSDRSYIGQSTNIKNRLKYHRTELRKGRHYNPKLQRAYNKYGESNMVLSIVETCAIEQLDDKEMYYISVYNSCVKGLNCNAGGNQHKKRPSNNKVYVYDASSGFLAGIYIGYVTAARAYNLNESNVRQSCKGKIKTAKGFHFSLLEKTPQQVLIDVTSKAKSEEHRLMRVRQFSGVNNPMYGKKRPDITGDKHPKRRDRIKKEIKLYEKPV